MTGLGKVTVRRLLLKLKRITYAMMEYAIAMVASKLILGSISPKSTLGIVNVAEYAPLGDCPKKSLWMKKTMSEPT